MSFGSSDLQRRTGGSINASDAPSVSYQNTSAQYETACQRVQGMLKDYAKLIAKIQGAARVMASGNGLSKAELSRMHHASQEANSLANDINKRLSLFSAFYKRGSAAQLTKREREDRRRQHQRLLKDSEALQSRFEGVIREALRAEQEHFPCHV